ncbi:efflux RND transporter periplasmic adaptor subunit [Candidatus Nomurabacteria bacterium]|nr:efflux RND transporter periplasmic adaptor subunit [Candidatus Nomurabacteria bacterium]
MQTVKTFIQKWAKEKRTYVIIVLVILVLFFILKPKIDETVVVDTVKLQDLESTVLASGEITSSTDLSLSFNSAGVVRTMNVEVGDKVYKGKVLATLDGGAAYGSLKSAEGAVKAAQAKYDKLVAGTSNEEINLSEVGLKNAEADLENTKRQQDTLVANAKKAFLNGGLEAISENNSSSPAPTISGTYDGATEGSYLISTYANGAGGGFSVSGLSDGGGSINTTSATLLDAKGLYVTFPSGFSMSSGNWKVNIPNKRSSVYLANLNAYNAALETRTNSISSAQSLVDSKTAELAVKRAAARTFELDLAQADVLSAQGQLESARATYNNTVIYAPAAGTITQVNVKLGELAQVQKEAIVLEDVDNLYLEASINEADIIKIIQGQKVDFLIDSFGTESNFEGEVIHIDPGATTSEGIVNYKIKVSMKNMDKRIKPGMNADIKILLNKKENVLVVPKLVLVDRDGKVYIRVITEMKTKSYAEREVTTGIEGDGNLIEILTGVVVDESIALVK